MSRPARRRPPLTKAERALVEAHATLPKMVVIAKWGGALKPQDIDDLISAGNLGLVDAAQRFDASMGFKFSSFASTRILGAALDWLRTLYGRGGYGVQPLTLAVRETDMMRRDDEGRLETLDSLIAGSSDTAASVVRLVEEVRLAVGRQLAWYFRRRTVQMAMAYYFDGRTLRDVATEFCVSEGRVSQLVGRIGPRVLLAIRLEVEDRCG